MSDDLVAWLRAQLDEDERWARGVLVPPAHWRESGITDAVVAGLARRQLVEVDAKRRIMAIHHPKKFEGMGGLPQICDGCGYGGICDDPITEDINDCPILRLLALPYADRPGYRPEWAPTSASA